MHDKPHTPEARAKMRAAHEGRVYQPRRQSQIVDGVEVWQCATCGEWKPREAFYGNKRQRCGLTSDCRPCHNAANVRARNRNRSRITNREYERRRRQNNPEKMRALYRAANQRRVRTERDVARGQLNNAVRRGILQRPTTCEQCGRAAKITAHHPDYSKPLEVEWLCYECHGTRHRRAAPPPPGSDAALALGCRCPVLDNAHGRGVEGRFWMSADCPLHGGGR